jgi:hypothetical protein
MTASYLKGTLLAMLGGGLSLREILTNGSLVLTCVGGMLAVLGGYWAYRSKRIEHRTREVELRLKEIELARAQNGGTSP